MFKQRLKVVFIVVWILGMLILALPTFSFTFGDQTINVNYSDRISRRIGSTLGNFNRSAGVFNSTEVTTELNFAEEDLSNEDKENKLDEYLRIIGNRAEAANLYDANISEKINPDENKYTLVFTYPEYYKDPVKYTEWLVSKGRIDFVTADQTNPSVLNVTVYDIIGTINLDYIDTINTHLAIKFKNEAVPYLQQAFQGNSQSAYFLMNIDSIPSYFIIQYDQYSNTNEELVRAVPTQAINLPDSKERNDYLNITRSYFLNNELEDSFSVVQETSQIKPIYKTTSALFIAELFIACAILLSVFYFIRFRKFGITKYVFAQLTFVLTFVVALKVLAGIISVSFLVGFILFYFIVNSILYYLITKQESEESVKENLRLTRDLSIFAFIVISLLYKLISNLGVFTDLIGVTLIGLITLFIMSIIHFRMIFDVFSKPVNLRKITLPRPKFRRKKDGKNK